MADISFWGGVGVIGSSKVLIEQDGWRVLFDLGLDFSLNPHLFRGRVAPRPGHILRDRLRTGAAPWIPHLYRSESVAGLDLAGGSDQRTALFITHAHPDHMGLTGWVDPDIPIYGSAATQRLMAALQTAGMGVEGGIPVVRPINDGGTVKFGPFRVTRHPVDHDVPGAAGYVVDTEDGRVAYTGDVRLHGRHPAWSLAFAKAVQGARALVIEGTTLSFAIEGGEPSESEVDQRFADVVRSIRGLVLLAVHPLNLERVAAFIEIARQTNRTILWPHHQAAFLRQVGLTEQIAEFDRSMFDAVRQRPDQYVLQLTVSAIPDLLDLPVGPESVFIHANGEPFGPYDPDWDVLLDWLRYTHTPFRPLGTSGHANPADLHYLVKTAAPDMVFPIHSEAPDRLMPPPGTMRCIPEHGRRYSLKLEHQGGQ